MNLQDCFNGLDSHFVIVVGKCRHRLPQFGVICLTVRYIMDVADDPVPGVVRRMDPQHLLVNRSIALVRTGTCYEGSEMLLPTRLAHPLFGLAVELTVNRAAVRASKPEEHLQAPDVRCIVVAVGDRWQCHEQYKHQNNQSSRQCLRQGPSQAARLQLFVQSGLLGIT